MKTNPIYSLVEKENGKGFHYRLKAAAGDNRGGLKSIDKIAKSLGYETPVLKKKTAADILDEWLELKDKDAKYAANPNLYEFAIDVLKPDSPLYARLDARRRKTKTEPIGLAYKKNLIRTIRRYEKILKPFRLANMKAKDVDGIVNDLIEDEDTSIPFINSLLDALRKVYDFAASQGLVDSNPARAVKGLSPSYEEREILNPHEVVRLISQMNDRSKNAWKEKLLYITELYSGMRRGEMASLRVCDIHPTKTDQGTDSEEVYTIEIKRNWNEVEKRFKAPKSGNARKVYIWKDLAELLRFHFEEFGLKNNDLVFQFPSLSENETCYGSTVFRGCFFKYLETNLGINEEERKKRNITFHSLRHYYDTAMQNNAMDMEVRKDIMEAVGHTTTKVDNIYIHESLFSKKLRLAKISGSLFNLKDFFPNGLPEHLLDEEERNVRPLNRNKHQMLLPNSDERNPSSVNV